MSNFLKVFLFNNFIGVLKETKSGALSFKYNQNVDYNLRLSMRIPVSSEIYSDKYARPFFENVLPEGDIRLKISNLKKISPNNIYKLIEAVGSECAGAVSLFPEDYEFDSFKSNSLIKLSENDLLNLIKNQNIAPLLMNNNNRLSLAGAQKKFALVKKDENYFFPDFENPSTTIIKVDNLNFPGIIENEFFCMKLAALSNIPVCDVDLKTIQDYKFLEVNRYDRFFESNKISRIHQEDFCQALGFISNRKYQSEGGPSIKNCVNLIRENFMYPLKDIELLVKILIFNILIGNCDAHAKNFSIIHGRKKNEYSLSSFYDIVCTVMYEDLSHKTAMRIGKEYNINDISFSNFIELSKEINIKPLYIEELINTIINEVRHNLIKLKEELSEKNILSPVFSKIEDYIHFKSKKLLKNK